MEEQFILRVPPSVSERIDRLLSENASSSEDKSLDLSFSEDGRSGTFVIGNDHFPAALLDLPCIVESYKTYDDNVLIKTADIGQMIMVREEGDAAPDDVEYRHGLTPPMRDARKRRFRREPDLNPELVRRVEKDLSNIMAGGTAENVDILACYISNSTFAITLSDHNGKLGNWLNNLLQDFIGFSKIHYLNSFFFFFGGGGVVVLLFSARSCENRSNCILV
ncbi:transcription initiation factor TFIID subunit 7 isoform X1 [Malania oleifera]|uniref:transcription initiation factor TFIID subunit 7 isoform X1 n=1 Tax=Malania oleifera TaxID=397392 RepID=UPI0025ADA3E4|nr:transcription initiation factor TFIID subunit 7 isoform X1 [Malania oleifera]